MAVVEITEEEFDDRTANGKVVVDCYADWCGPCRLLSPVVEKVSEQVTDYKFYKLNMDEADEIAEDFEISSIPTILVFNNGELVNQGLGFMSIDELKALLQ